MIAINEVYTARGQKSDVWIEHTLNDKVSIFPARNKTPQPLASVFTKVSHDVTAAD